MGSLSFFIFIRFWFCDFSTELTSFAYHLQHLAIFMRDSFGHVTYYFLPFLIFRFSLFICLYLYKQLHATLLQIWTMNSHAKTLWKSSKRNREFDLILFLFTCSSTASFWICLSFSSCTACLILVAFCLDCSLTCKYSIIH